MHKHNPVEVAEGEGEEHHFPVNCQVLIGMKSSREIIKYAIVK